MSHALADRAPDPATTERRGSLLRAELLRFRTRRLVRALLLVGVLLLLGGSALAATQFAVPTAAELAEAEAQIEESVAQQEVFRAECLAREVPAGFTGEEYCGPPVDRSFYSTASYLDRAPFELGALYFDGALAVGFLAAALSFVVGVTFVGAEWSQRSLVALLFWEPRRTRVISRKLVVAGLAGAAFGALLVLAWFGAAHLLGALRGSTDVPAGFYPAALGQGARLVLLAGLTGLGGAALANLVRGTGAALGAAFFYVVVVETAVRGVVDTGPRWLLSTAATALGSRDGTSFFVSTEQVQPDGSIFYESQEVLVSGLAGATLLGAVVAVGVLVGTVLFVRRDLQ